MKVIHGLVACSDLTGYARLAGKKSDEEIFALLSTYYELVGDTIAPSGRVIKFMGDAALMFFPETDADTGVRALLALQKEGDRFWAERGLACHHHVRAHFGVVCVGPIGTKAEKREDILGAAVNTLFLLKTSGFALTSEAFRQLKPETRRLFKKHTPPVAYIPNGQAHRD